MKNFKESLRIPTSMGTSSLMRASTATFLLLTDACAICSTFFTTSLGLNFLASHFKAPAAKKEKHLKNPPPGLLNNDKYSNEDLKSSKWGLKWG
jgi:preprotein translocase subunit SecG